MKESGKENIKEEVVVNYKIEIVVIQVQSVIH